MQSRHYLLTAGLICTSVLLNVTIAKADQNVVTTQKIQSVQVDQPTVTSQSTNNTSVVVAATSQAHATDQLSQSTEDRQSNATSAAIQVSAVASASTSVATSEQASQTPTSTAQSAAATIQSVQSQAGSISTGVTSQAGSVASTAQSQYSQAASSQSATTSSATSVQSVASSAAPVASQAVVPSPKVGPGDYDGKIAHGMQSYSNNSEFLTEIKPGAVDGWHQYHVLPSITAAQAILESGWGSSQLSKIGNNLFGIKGNYNGNSVTYPTKEFVNGHYEVVNAAFRQYPNQSASISDHGAFLNINARYQNLLNQQDYHQVAQLLQQDGYATDPHYAELLVLLIEQNGLASWDQLAFKGQTLPEAKPQVPVNQPEKAIQGRYTFKTATGIYTKPDFNADVIGQYAQGEAVNYQGEQTIAGTKWLKYTAFSGQVHYVPISETAKPVVESVSGQYRFAARTTIHAAPNGNSPAIGHYAAGETVYFNGKVQVGEQTWLRYEAYSGRAHYVLMGAAKAIPEIQETSGTHLFTQRTDIRTSPDWQASVVGQYWTGETVYYNGKVTIDGTTWLRYLAQSGQTHYVPVAANDHPMVVKTVHGAHRVNAWTAIHATPATGTPIVGYYGRGETVYYIAQVTVNGQTWLKYLANSGQYHYVQLENNDNNEQGQFTFKTTTNIRLSAGLSGAIVGEYYPGETVHYIGKVWADGYTWLKYIARDGRYHYVAVIE